MGVNNGCRAAENPGEGGGAGGGNPVAAPDPLPGAAVLRWPQEKPPLLALFSWDFQICIPLNGRWASTRPGIMR